MSELLEKSLDEIINSKKASGKNFGSRKFGSSDRKSDRTRKPHRPRHRDHSHQFVESENPEIKELSGGNPYVKITNLHVDLTEKDISDLFSTLGEVSFARLEFDTNGVSLGVGYVGYVDPSNCSKAISKFDGRKAAGQIISVSNGVPLASRISLAPRSGSNRPKYSKKQRNSAKPKPKHKPTMEELDAELEAYKQGSAAKPEDSKESDNADMEIDSQQKPFPAAE